MNKLMMTLSVALCALLFVSAPHEAQAGKPMAHGGHGMKTKHIGNALRQHAGHLALHKSPHFIKHAGHPLGRAHGFSHGRYGLGGFGYGVGGHGYGLGGYGYGLAGAGIGLGGSIFGLNGFDVPDGLSLYRRRMIPVPPYFSLHPPVYYSGPVARSYGMSPFPYPGDVTSPPVEELYKPAVVENPFVSPTEKKVEEDKPEPTDDSVAEVAPEMIRNPYVDMTVRDEEIHVAKTVK